MNTAAAAHQAMLLALFVAPLLVLASLAAGPAPMDLAFSGGMVLTLLLAVYLILGLTFFFAPVAG